MKLLQVVSNYNSSPRISIALRLFMDLLVSTLYSTVYSTGIVMHTIIIAVAVEITQQL